MDVTFKCLNCGAEVYIDLAGSGKLECTECGSRELEWIGADLSQFGCA